MTIKLDLYKIFKEVAYHQNISKASKELFISQSAVSQAIKQLEDQLETTLFRRTPKGVQLTNEGNMLYEYVNSALDLIDSAESKIEAMKNLDYGALKIGASDTISKYLLLEQLEKFNRIYPKIKLQIVNRTSNEAISLLKSGKIDLAYINMPVFDDEIVVEPYMDVNDIFVVAKDSKFDTQKTYSLKDISTMPLILLEKKSNSRVYVENFFNSNGYKISPEIELGSHELLLEFAKIRLGISCVIKEFSKDYLNNGDLVEIKLDKPIPKRQIGIASLKGVSLSKPAKMFIDM